nr:hypothetical protein [Cryomorphaceae bacterium]
MKRSEFIKTLGLGAVGVFAGSELLASSNQLLATGLPPVAGRGAKPLSIGTWPFAEHTTRASLEAMQKGA